MYPSDCLYTKEHEWVRVDGETAVIGITEFAQSELGDVVFVELPEAGQSFDANDEIGTIESVKAVAEVFTPVSGDIAEVNEALNDEPEVLNDDPHGNGWLVKVKISDSEELKNLMTAEQYAEFVDGGDD